MKKRLDYLLGIPLTWALSLFASKKEFPSAPKKVLVIKLAAAGDTILLGPVLRSFRAAHPNAEIHWLVSPINAALAERNPHVDRVMVWSGGLGGIFSLLRSLRKERYDTVCDLEQWSRGTAILAFLSGAPRRIGFDTVGQRRTFLFTETTPKRFDRHEIDEFYGLLSLLAPLERSRDFDLSASPEGRRELSELISLPDQKRKRVLIHPGCGSDGFPREWPVECYGVLAHWLMKKHQAEIFLTSGPEERKKTRQLNRLIKGSGRDFGGRLSWQGLIALVERMDLVVSGNTGVMHVAAALRKKQVALHGPTNPLLWGPLNPHAKVVRTSCPKCPCLKLGFEYHADGASCMRKIDVEQVKSAIGDTIGELIDKGGAI